MKKKGFTLVELLAVIVILAIVMIIAIPQILDAIERAEIESFRESVELMVHTAQVQYNADEVQGRAKPIPEEGLVYEYAAEGKDTVQTQESIDEAGYLNFKGDKPRSGTITLAQNKKVEVNKVTSKMHNGKYCAIKDYTEKSVRVGKSSDSSFNCATGGEEIIVDKKPCDLEVGEETINGSTQTVYYIDSVEDFYRFANDVKAGNSYSNKVLKIRNNLDFSGYTADKKPKVCDNGDNENGYSPIDHFGGILHGGAKKISNLTINRPSQNNVAIFGDSYNGITVKGLILENIKATGNANVGSLIASVQLANISEVVVKDVDITASSGNASALIASNWNTGDIDNVLIKSAKVTGGNVYAIAPNTRTNSHVVENFNGTYTSGQSIGTPYYSSSVTLNGQAQTSGFSSSDKGDINFYETIGLDTWIGGDNNNSGYYFDYESTSSSNIVLKTSATLPTSLDSVLSKDSNDKYLIKNANDWKNAAAFSTVAKNLKISSDINFNGKHYYMLGSNSNYFNGNIDGSNKTISNVTINASKANNIGMIGVSSNSKQIYGLNLDNITIKGNANVGALVGNCQSIDIYKILLKNINISAPGGNAASIIGTNFNSGTINNILVKNGNITGATVYGIAPYTRASNNMIENMTITYTSAMSLGGSSYSSNVVANSAHPSGGIASGTLSNINYAEFIGMDTWIGGNNDSTGYYYDYENDSSNNIVMKDTTSNPIPTSLDATFSKDTNGKYLITSEEDWKKAAAFTTTSKTLKLTNNLNFSNKHFYIFGSSSNYFNGNIDGGAKTISNITITAPGINDVGIIGDSYNGVQIYGMNLKNITISGNANVGTIIGAVQSADVYEISLENINLTAASGNVGTTIGSNWNSGTVNNILVKSGTITGTTGYGIAPYPRSSNNLIENLNINASNNSIGTSYYSRNVSINGDSQTSGFSPSNINNLDYYYGKIETVLNGDSNGTGYYYDIDSSKGGIYIMPVSSKSGWELLNSKLPLDQEIWVYWENNSRIQSGWHRLKDFSDTFRWYYFENGYVVLGWKTIDGNKYYLSTFDDDGNGYTDCGRMESRDAVIGGQTYTFDSNGICTNCN